MTTRYVLTVRISENHNGEMGYAEPDIREKATEVHELEGKGLLAVLVDGIHVSFAVFDWESGPASDGGPAYYRVVFHGEGPSDSLRELRHTYWGDNGYIFYPNGKLIADAFAKLGRWFDCD